MRGRVLLVFLGRGDGVELSACSCILREMGGWKAGPYSL